MRVLCLHGMGTNSGIFEAQSEIFRGMLPKHFEYDFFDADHEIQAAEGCENVFPGPYTCWYPVPTRTNVKAAHELIWEFIEEEGPYDAVMGFSQGAALAASLLINHQLEKPDSPPPFRLAIFVCGSLPYCIDGTNGVDVASLFAEPPAGGFGPVKYTTYQPWNDDGSSVARPLYEGRECTLKKERQTLAEVVQMIDDHDNEDGKEFRLRVDEMAEEDFNSSDSSSESEGDSPVFSPITETGYNTETSSVIGNSTFEDINLSFRFKHDDWDGVAGDNIIRRFHADNDEVRIEIPTAHIIGKKDPYLRQGIELQRLCDPQWSSLYEHPEGHVVPRNNIVNKQIAAAIERAIAAVEISAR
ncbi:hypothetical protein H2198_000306 [Neophaeococcomyces mojaviensis]|uniref:Uncharacterized protein n=1 Tax=Neophaeococcomyces mojaviensis TaxID=3383035 RepID=A0ACC3AKU9_9EURO|nr:hypothetical protein H2198_000306 [Knufia sp. JES_112]